MRNCSDYCWNVVGLGIPLIVVTERNKIFVWLIQLTRNVNLSRGNICFINFLKECW